MKTALELIQDERAQQIEEECFDDRHDDLHDNDELAFAAATYAITEFARRKLQGDGLDLWPWSISWFKPSDRMRDLAKAGALILAEMERLQRLEQAQIKQAQEVFKDVNAADDIYDGYSHQ